MDLLCKEIDLTCYESPCSDFFNKSSPCPDPAPWVLLSPKPKVSNLDKLLSIKAPVAQYIFYLHNNSRLLLECLEQYLRVEYKASNRRVRPIFALTAFVALTFDEKHEYHFNTFEDPASVTFLYDLLRKTKPAYLRGDLTLKDHFVVCLYIMYCLYSPETGYPTKPFLCGSDSFACGSDLFSKALEYTMDSGLGIPSSSLGFVLVSNEVTTGLLRCLPKQYLCGTIKKVRG